MLRWLDQPRPHRACQLHEPVIDVSCSGCGDGPLITGQPPGLAALRILHQSSSQAKFSRGMISFVDAEFSGGMITFGASFSAPTMPGGSRPRPPLETGCTGNSCHAPRARQGGQR